MKRDSLLNLPLTKKGKNKRDKWTGHLSHVNSYAIVRWSSSFALVLHIKPVDDGFFHIELNVVIVMNFMTITRIQLSNNVFMTRID